MAGGIFQAPAQRIGRPVVVPSLPLQREADDAIFSELVRGNVSGRVLRVLRGAIDELARLGAASIILGNTD